MKECGTKDQKIKNKTRTEDGKAVAEPCALEEYPAPVIVLPMTKRKRIDELLEVPSKSGVIEAERSLFVNKYHASNDSLFPVGVVGLANLKNTCFANAVLQSLSNCIRFRQYLENLKLPLSCPTEFVCFQISKLLRHMWSGEHELLSPSSLLSSIQHNVKYEFGVEEDAHWFLQVLLQILDEEILTKLSIQQSISELFETKRCRQSTCNSCKEVTVGSQSRIMINTLPLPNADEEEEDIKQSSICILEDCLLLASKDSDIAACHKCFGYDFECFEQAIAITQLPQILCFHFNRYRWTGKVIQRATRSGAKGKNNTRVIFPLKLDMSPYLSLKADREYSQYYLASVVVHDGLTPATGHYYTLSYNTVNGKWYKFDDDKKPAEVSESYVLKANPFMLFYQPQPTVKRIRFVSRARSCTLLGSESTT